MENGLIGEFARDKIAAIVEAIDNGDASKTILQQIELIGDARIKEYLLKKVAQRDIDSKKERDIDSEIEYYKCKIRELRRKK